MYQDVRGLIKFIENEVIKPGSLTVFTHIRRKELTYMLPLVRGAHTWIHVDEDSDVRDFLNRIQLLITNAGQDHHLLCDIGSSEQDRVTHDTLQEIWLLKPDMILFLRLLPKLIRAFGFVPSADDNLEFLLNYKADFVAPVKEKIEIFKGNLKILKGFLPFMLNNSNFQSNEFNNLCDLFTVVVEKVSYCIALLCLADELDEDMADCISFMMIDLLQSIQHAKSDIRSYVAGLKLLHTTIEFTRELDVLFISS